MLETKYHVQHTAALCLDRVLYNDIGLVQDLETQTRLLIYFLYNCYSLGFLISAVYSASDVLSSMRHLFLLQSRLRFLLRRYFMNSHMHVSYGAFYAFSYVVYEIFYQILRNLDRFTSLELLSRTSYSCFDCILVLIWLLDLVLYDQIRRLVQEFEVITLLSRRSCNALMCLALNYYLLFHRKVA